MAQSPDTIESHKSPASRSFVGYLLMSFLTAANDSLFRWLIVPIAKYRQSTISGLTTEQAEAQEATVLAVGLGAFILPFVIFGPLSGWLADRFS
ncbi:MAG: hypothetical protein KDA89_03605, partial [Planctomycetaceae bacterium]|nr:hypothetical protein [Planctomycetaceae bacterium]